MSIKAAEPRAAISRCRLRIIRPESRRRRRFRMTLGTSNDGSAVSSYVMTVCPLAREVPGAVVLEERLSATVMEDQCGWLLLDPQDEVDAFREQRQTRLRLFLHKGPSGPAFANDARANARHEAGNLFVV